MSITKKIGIGVLAFLVIVQFFRPARNKSTEVLQTDITRVTTVPDNVHQVLVRSCYDCHSNNTVYPWYMDVQPVAWYLANHIKDGKQELNFSEFGGYTAKKQLHKLQSIAKEVQKGDMPLSSYTLIHTDAKLNAEEARLLIGWADTLAARY